MVVIGNVVLLLTRTKRCTFVFHPVFLLLLELLMILFVSDFCFFVPNNIKWAFLILLLRHRPHYNEYKGSFGSFPSLSS